MAKPKQDDTADIRFVDELPARGRHAPWVERLQPLTRHPRRWAEVYQAEDPYQARDAVSNLNRRRIIIPRPDHDWKFASRGVLVFAMYGGPGKKAKVRRGQ